MEDLRILRRVVDMDAAIGFVVARGDRVERARLSWLRTGAPPPPEALVDAENGQARGGGWPATWNGHVASVDATCFRLAELDDLGALHDDAGQRALDWLATRQRDDGTWEEDEALAGAAPQWARPGDPEALLYLTANAAYWLTAAAEDARGAAAGAGAPAPAGAARHAAVEEADGPGGGSAYAQVLARAGEAIRARLRPDGTWPSFLAAGWLSAAVLHWQNHFYESARIQLVLADRVPQMSPADTAAMIAALRRVGISTEEWLLVAARRRLAETQRSDGGWSSDDGEAFDVHITLAAIRACR